MPALRVRFPIDPPSRLLRSFAFGHLAKSLMWSFSDLFFGYFAHVHMGLPAAETGTIIFVSLVYSGCLDILAAMLLSAFPGYEGKVPRLQFVGAVLTSATGLLLFWPISFPAGLLVNWMLVTSLLFRTGYGLYDVSRNALVSLLPRDEPEARRYVTTRTTLSYVPPPISPAGTPDEFVTRVSPTGIAGGGRPIGAGFRVPCIIVSPWTAGGRVCSEPFDHTSNLRLLERITGVEAPNIPAWRRETFGDLTAALRFHAPPAAPPKLRGTREADMLVQRGGAFLPPSQFPSTNQVAPAQQHGKRPTVPPGRPRA